MNQIEDTDEKLQNIFIGDVEDCDNELLDEYGITSVLNVSTYNPRIRAMMGYRYIQIPLHDSESIDRKSFVYAVDVARDLVKQAWFNKERCLVHCAAGQSRSVAVLATAIAKYLQQQHLREYTFGDGLSFVQEARPSANPIHPLRQEGVAYLLGEVEN